MVRLKKLVAALALAACGITVAVAGSEIPKGIWKLDSQKVILGDPPSFSPGVIMTLEDKRGVARSDSPALGHSDRPLPAGVLGHDRIKSDVSSDGRILTWDTSGVDAKTGKAYRYLLVWEK